MTGFDLIPEDDVLEKIARMELAEVSFDHICLAIGIDLPKLETIRESEQYQAVVQRVAINELEFNNDLNNGWDMVEHLALRTLVDRLKITADPQLALRAAMVANKATRRGMHQQRPIQVNGEQTVNVVFNKTFVTKVQNNQLQIRERTERDPEEIPKKQQDFLEPKSVENMLSMATDLDREKAIEHDDKNDMMPDIIGALTNAV